MVDPDCNWTVHAAGQLWQPNPRWHVGGPWLQQALTLPGPKAVIRVTEVRLTGLIIVQKPHRSKVQPTDHLFLLFTLRSHLSLLSVPVCSLLCSSCFMIYALASLLSLYMIYLYNVLSFLPFFLPFFLFFMIFLLVFCFDALLLLVSSFTWLDLRGGQKKRDT